MSPCCIPRDGELALSQETAGEKRVREMRPRVGRRVTVLLTAVAALLISSCSSFDPNRQVCRELRSAPFVRGVSWLAEVPGQGRPVARSSAAIALYREAGISLYLYRGHRLFGANELYRCRRLSPAELEQWGSAIDALLTHLELRQGEGREAIVVAGSNGEGLGLAAVAELGPEGRLAAERLACKVFETFGEAGSGALHEASPRLTEDLNLSTSCQQGEQQGIREG